MEIKVLCRGNPLGDICMKVLGNLLEGNSTCIEKLYLANVGITEESNSEFLGSIRNIKRLKILRLENNLINNNDAKFTLQKFLGPNSILIYLNLSNCELTDELGHSLFNSINNNNDRLKTLILSKNKLGSSTGKMIKEALSNPKTVLSILDLSNNRLNVLYLISIG